MVRENGEVVQGSLARVEPEGEVMRMWEAIEIYMQRSQPLINCGRRRLWPGVFPRAGQLRGVRLAGVEVIAAEGFERITGRI